MLAPGQQNGEWCSDTSPCTLWGKNENILNFVFIICDAFCTRPSILWTSNCLCSHLLHTLLMGPVVRTILLTKNGS